MANLSGFLLVCSALFPYPDWQGKYNVKCMQNSDPNNAQYKDLNVSNSINRQVCDHVHPQPHSAPSSLMLEKYTWLQCNEP